MGFRLFAFSLCALAVLPANSFAQSAPNIRATRITTGLVKPLFVTAPPDDFNNLFIVQQTGQVRRFDLQRGLLDTKPFFNISSLLASSSGEQGLLGLAFDPNYTNNRKFYLYFIAPGGAWGNGVSRISQFSEPVTRAQKKKRRTPEKLLLQFDQPQTNHNGGWIGFSPRADDNRNLYIASGDGGNANDQGTGHIEPGGNAQSNVNLLGKILRIRVDPSSATVSIPPNNPFFGHGSFRQEIWTFGLRNPYRASFDRGTGRFFIGDVGQSAREEVDVQQPTNPGGGENYEWRLREGTIATPGGGVGGARPPGGVLPILDYDRSVGGTVIGGYVYRGSQIPSLQGTYVFGDYVANKIFTLNYDGTTVSNFNDVTAQIFPTLPGGFRLSSFGEDASGEIYFTDISNGAVYKIIAGP